MRPDRFLQLAVTAAQTIPGTTARVVPIGEDGRSKRPYLFTVETGGKTTRWQITAASAPGDVYSQPEREPVLGAACGSRPGLGRYRLVAEHVESALLAAILDADSGEIAAVDAYSRRAQAGAIQHGATILFHNGAKIFLNSVR
jgi:hypothetical protein